MGGPSALGHRSRIDRPSGERLFQRPARTTRRSASPGEFRRRARTSAVAADLGSGGRRRGRRRACDRRSRRAIRSLHHRIAEPLDRSRAGPGSARSRRRSRDGLDRRPGKLRRGAASYRRLRKPLPRKRPTGPAGPLERSRSSRPAAKPRALGLARADKLAVGLLHGIFPWRCSWRYFWRLSRGPRRIPLFCRRSGRGGRSNSCRVAPSRLDSSSFS